MARTRTFALFVAVVLTLAGCSAFFEFNAFSSLDKAAVPDPSRYQGSGGLANLQADLASPSVVNALKSSPSTVATILANLDNAYGVTTGPLTTPDQQTAAILYADLALKSTSGDALVNNIVATVMTQTTGNLQSVLSSIVPADVAADPAKFAAMVNGLLAANIAYDKLGQSLASLPAPPGMNMGDTAQKAAVAWLMYCVDVSVVGAGFAPPSDVDEMFKLVNNQANSIGGLSTTPANPFSPMSGAGLTPPSLQRIFDAAGAPYPA
jgi:hypothetical protein